MGYEGANEAARSLPRTWDVLVTVKDPTRRMHTLLSETLVVPWVGVSDGRDCARFSHRDERVVYVLLSETLIAG